MKFPGEDEKLEMNILFFFTLVYEIMKNNLFIPIVVSFRGSIFKLRNHISTSKNSKKNHLFLKNILFTPQRLELYILPIALERTNYQSLWERLRTYKEIPEQHNEDMYAINLAIAGFIYDGNSAHGYFNVRCPFCGLSKSTQQLGNNALETHMSQSPSCPMPHRDEEGSYSELLSLTTSTDHDYNTEPILGFTYHGISTDIPLNGIQIPASVHSHQVSLSPSMATISAASSISDSRTPASPVLNRNSVLPTSARLVSGLPNPPPAVGSVQSNGSVGHSTSTVAAPSTTVLETTVNSSQNTVKSNAGGPTYSELSIITERPKRIEYALLAKRMETFLSWPRDHHLRPKELSEAGFYYAGYGDCARCFYCGGGLRNWEDEDDVWVEHARWFPNCAYIRQQLSQVFVDTVQELHTTNDCITMPMVMSKIENTGSVFQLVVKEDHENGCLIKPDNPTT